MKYRFILPGLYALLLLLAISFFIKGAGGHGPNPFNFVVYLMMPLCLLLNLLPASLAPKSGLFSFLLCALMGVVQWALIGYVIDKLLARRHRPKLKTG